MSRPRVKARMLAPIGIALVLATITSVAAGWLPVAGASRRGAPLDVVPGDAAQAALAVLGAPSTPQPVAGSESVGPDRYRFAAGCAALVAAYQQPDAPVPAGTVVTVVTDGGVRFEAPFGPAAVFTRNDADGGCTYEIRSAPTLVVSGPDVPAIAGFFTVSCFQPFGISFVAVAQIDVDAVPHTFAMVQSEPVTTPPTPLPATVGWYIGLPADVIAGSSDQPGAQRFEGLTSIYDAATGAGTATGAGPTGPIDVSFQCTVGNLTLPGF